MRVDLPSLRTDSVTGSNAPTLLAQWRVGTILQAVTVVDAAGRLYLDIGNARYAARLASSDSGVPRNGERLQLKVLRESPVLAFEAVRLTTSNEASNPTVDALRRFVPRQDSPAPLAANLALLASSSKTELPPAVRQAAAKLWRAMPEAEALVRPQQLRQALTDSGAFLEAKLAGAPTPSGSATLNNDLKALSLQLARVVAEAGGRANAAPSTTVAAPVPTSSSGLQPLPSSPPTLAILPNELQLHELARQTEGAVARLTALQVANSAPDPTPALLLELPVRFGDEVSLLRLRIERDSSGESPTPEATPSVWTVEAALDLGAAGALHARIVLQGQRLDVQLRATAPDVVAALRTQSEQLSSLLRESGLDVQRIACLHGLPPVEAASSPPRLLDLHA
jgi:Flagellar hook-length control protein FliK